MNRAKFGDFKALKAAVTIEQLLRHDGLVDRMKRSGDSLNGCCAIHQGTSTRINWSAEARS